MTRVAVVGAGITGLATAFELQLAGEGLEVTVIEAAPAPGGKVAAGEVGGRRVDLGPDSFLARVPQAAALCASLGLELTEPATGRALILSRGRLRPLPPGLVLGVPARVGPLVRSGLISPLGLARAAGDLVLPSPRRRAVVGDPDRSVAEVIGGRFGAEVLERLVDPLLGGIHAGRSEQLSLASVAPPVAEAAAMGGSLLRALRKRPGGGDGPVFQTVPGGLTRLIDRLASQAEDLRLDTSVVKLSRHGDRYRLELSSRQGEDTSTLDAAVVILAVPAPVAARLVADLSSEASRELAAIEYASVATVTLAYRPADIAHPLDASGFLVPRVEGRTITACTFLTSKWSHLTGDQVLLRASVGRHRDPPPEVEDGVLVERVHAELADLLGLGSGPRDSLVQRWPASLPQYQVGHRARIERVRRNLAEKAPGVMLTGAAYDGIGIASCVAAAGRTAAAVAARSA